MALVEARQKRHLCADGRGHRPGGNLPGQPVVEDVDLFVVLGERVGVGRAIPVGVGCDPPHFECDFGHPLHDAAAERAHIGAEIAGGALGDVLGQIAAPLELWDDEEDADQVAKGRRRQRLGVAQPLPDEEFDFRRQVVDRLVPSTTRNPSETSLLKRAAVAPASASETRAKSWVIRTST